MEETNVAALLSDFSTRVKAIEEKHNLLRERVLVLAQSFIKQERELQKEMKILQDDMKTLKANLSETKDKVEHLLTELSELARRDELRVVEKYIKLWEPLKYTKKEEVEELIKEAINQALKKNRKK